MRSVELFSGAGGLALGTARAGFKHELLVEKDEMALRTLVANRERGIDHACHWDRIEEDARCVDYGTLEKDMDLVAGGPPCQPFSIGGKHKGPDDHRDMWPEAVRAIRELTPRAFLFENVRGLVRPAFSEYLDYILARLEWPLLVARKGESWTEHLDRIRKHAIDAKDGELRYRVHLEKVNAADYGVPQKRHRVIIVGLRNDLECEWEFPKKTHSRERLVWDQLVSGDYWRARKIPSSRRPEPSPQDLRLAERLKKKGDPPEGKPWVTVRDILGDLPEPCEEGMTGPILNHLLQPGARSYVGHTGSPLDQPAKALKAGVHGVPGGENMLARHDGSVRYFSVREAARLQCFPDDFFFPGAWTVSLRQLGNAVPVKLAETIASSIANSLKTIDGISSKDRQAA